MTTPTSGKDTKQAVIGFARYCNTLSPRKLQELLDPIVEGAIDDFVDRIAQSNQAAVRAALEGLIQKAFWSLNEDGDAAGVVSVSTIEAAIKENDIK